MSLAGTSFSVIPVNVFQVSPRAREINAFPLYPPLPGNCVPPFLSWVLLLASLSAPLSAQDPALVAGPWGTQCTGTSGASCPLLLRHWASGDTPPTELVLQAQS